MIMNNKIERHLCDLETKVEKLHEIVEVLAVQVTKLASDQHLEVELTKPMSNNYTHINDRVPLTNSHYTQSSSVLVEQDLIFDGMNGEPQITTHHYNELSISQDTQIHRLTAQLTAAYNQIAALEEQLLARRCDFPVSRY